MKRSTEWNTDVACGWRRGEGGRGEGAMVKEDEGAVYTGEGRKGIELVRGRAGRRGKGDAGTGGGRLKR